ncbi:MAG: DUF3737 family protein, partial [Prevotella sp.]|nr:DUF3737 family protein [Prevotella sp.]
MKKIQNKSYGGERPLYASHDLELENVTILEGESALKECSNITAHGCRFEGNYPLWRTFGLKMTDCTIVESSRAALWYTTDLVMTDSLVEGPKVLREMDDITLERVNFPKAVETLWKCRNVKMRDCTV